jgi:hypothetical protein
MTTGERYTTKEPGLNLYRMTEIDRFHHDLEKALQQVSRLQSGNNHWNVHQRLTKYAELTAMMVKILIRQNESLNGLWAEYNQLTGHEGERARKRWTEREDEILVDQACQDGMTLLQLALAFNRTPGAVSSRLTYLVGVSKVSRVVAGRLIGYLDGEPVDGHFEGKLTEDGSIR